MKKDVLFPLLTCVGLGLCANSLILSLPLSVISKGTCLILSSFVFSSVALMVLALVLRDTWSTTKGPDSLNRLATLAEKEKEILAGKATKRTIDDYGSFTQSDFDIESAYAHGAYRSN
ncbi:hypothetical protein [Klebsiella phage KP32]|uniref:Uncharacterized protein 17 n=1 Tax=Klebsiella phage KP32 TaxID=674082 RepID=D1L2V0_BPK32|nr:hypothetical protein KP-KP32_gp17 [Klebsiella phage KP32]ACY66679.1 hypothetical protein [Klebsiella phage KP32]